MADFNLFLFIGIGVILGGVFILSCIYVICKLCSEYMYPHPLDKEKDAECMTKFNTDRKPEENSCEYA